MCMHSRFPLVLRAHKTTIKPLINPPFIWLLLIADYRQTVKKSILAKLISSFLGFVGFQHSEPFSKFICVARSINNVHQCNSGVNREVYNGIFDTGSRISDMPMLGVRSTRVFFQNCTAWLIPAVHTTRLDDADKLNATPLE